MGHDHSALRAHCTAPHTTPQLTQREPGSTKSHVRVSNLATPQTSTERAMEKAAARRSDNGAVRGGERALRSTQRDPQRAGVPHAAPSPASGVRGGENNHGISDQDGGRPEPRGADCKGTRGVCGSANAPCSTQVLEICRETLATCAFFCMRVTWQKYFPQTYNIRALVKQSITDSH